MTARRAREKRREKTIRRLLGAWIRHIWRLPDHGRSVPLPIHLHMQGCTIHPHGTYQLCRWDIQPEVANDH